MIKTGDEQMVNITAYLGKELRELRSSLNLTQETFASDVGITQNALSQYENDLRPINAETVISISKCYKKLGIYLSMKAKAEEYFINQLIS